MNPEVKTDWAVALRSGEFKQGKNALRTPEDTYCCLGVLCELAVRAGVIPAPVLRPPTRSGGKPHYSYVGQRLVLPEAVRVWAGLDSVGPQIWEPAKSPVGLALLNDADTSFPEIATLIEEYL